MQDTTLSKSIMLGGHGEDLMRAALKPALLQVQPNAKRA